MSSFWIVVIYFWSVRFVAKSFVVTLGEGLAPEISIYFFYDFFMIFL